jgi:voltage-gated potassium channel
MMLSKERIFEILAVDGDHRLSHSFDVFIMSLIAANVLAVILSTVDPLYTRFGAWFQGFELLSVIVFTIEYLGRIWTATFDPEYSSPITGRLRFAGKPMLVIDLLAILPFYLGSLLVDLRFLRALRLLRFFRLLKLARYSESMQRFGRVVKSKREDLTVAIAGTVILLIVASSLMYFVENAAQPEAFSSIPKSLWWGVVTLTTVGYGDVYPVTLWGRALGAIIAILGVGLVALPASILASGFIEEARGDEEICPHCGKPLTEDHEV